MTVWGKRRHIMESYNVSSLTDSYTDSVRELIDLIVQAAVSKVEANRSDAPSAHYETDRNAAADALAKLMTDAAR